MALEKSEALVLRVLPFRDTSKILTVYSADHGLVSLLAKGVRGPKPRFGAALELFAHIDLVYYEKNSRDLQLLSQATLLEAHLPLGSSALRFAYGAAVLEFLLKALTGHEPPGRLYPLSLKTLSFLAEGPDDALPGVFRAFEIKAVSFLGHRPELYLCVECGREVEGMTRVGFSPLAGGMVCPACIVNVPGVLPMHASAGILFRRLMLATLEEVTNAPPDPRSLAALAGILEPFLQAHIERYEFLRSLRLAQGLDRAVLEFSAKDRSRRP